VVAKQHGLPRVDVADPATHGPDICHRGQAPAVSAPALGDVHVARLGPRQAHRVRRVWSANQPGLPEAAPVRSADRALAGKGNKDAQ